MNSFLLACFGGVLWVQQQASLPSLWALAACVAILWLARARMRYGLPAILLGILLGLSLGASYATLRAQWRLAERLPVELDGHDLAMTGVVRGLPQQFDDGVRFLFEPDAVYGVARLPTRMRLSWYGDGAAQPMPPRLGPGDPLELTVRLRRPTSQFNPGGFDHAGWYFANGIGAKGYVRSGHRISRASAPSLQRLRDRLRRWIEAHASPVVAPLLVAMSVGDQGSIADAQWTTLRATGTAHLVAISGMHISIMAALAGGFVGFLWRRIPGLVLRLPASRAAIAGGMAMALCHGALAGYGIPVMRAVIMVLIAALAMWRTRRPPALRVLLLALVGVLLVDPWAVLSAGFWLSFGAVSALMLVLSGRAGRTGRVGQFLRSQWAIGLLTAPLLLGAFGQLSLVAPLANLVAIPVVTLLVVPVLLLALACQSVWLLAIPAYALERIMAFLDVLAGWPLASWSAAVAPTPLLVTAMLGAAMGLLPRGTPARGLGLLLMLLAVAWRPAAPPTGAFDARVYDVGQGLAVRIRTATHSLVYDAGPRYFRGGDAGRSVLVPALQHEGLVRLDRLVLSHDDSDHTGGAKSLLESVAVARVTAGDGVQLTGVAVDRCRAGEAWTWDGVRFIWLNPSTEDRGEDDNNRSCVLSVRGRTGSLLLTGDIQRPAEARMAARGRLAPTTIVVAPHHGSKSSSSAALIDTVHARVVIFSAGLDNMYGHPAALVVDRWRQAGARPWNTADTGMLEIHWDDAVPVVEPYAPTHRRYWHRPPS